MIYLTIDRIPLRNHNICGVLSETNPNGLCVNASHYIIVNRKLVNPRAGSRIHSSLRLYESMSTHEVSIS